jgi:uncharacterized SAM-binding protein YcdF (DUF218 family)
MDNLFFYVSKLVWAVISPDSLLVFLAAAAWISLALGRKKLSRSLLAITSSLLLLIGFLPVGEWLISPLEKRFAANTALPQSAQGIIVLGGAIDPYKSRPWQQAELNAAADRITNFLYLASLYPEAQLVFSGGNGEILHQDYKEAEMTRVLLDQLGLDQRAIIYESESRNTHENVLNSKNLLSPKDHQNWLLVTSAYHMPRAVGVFCRQQWNVQAYPVDHYSKKDNLLRIEFNFVDNLSVLKIAMREWVGLLAYRLSGKTGLFLPSSENYCSI